jgi:hypothetical protein
MVYRVLTLSGVDREFKPLLFSHIMVRTSYILCDDDDDVYFVLDQHAELDIYSASSLKQQTVDRHVTPLGHNLQYFSYIMAVSFIGGGIRRTQRKPLTC